MADKTNYAQSLMHMIKGNLGTGILAMPASFAHTGLINAIIGLPLLCLVSTYCVHLLVRSSQQLEGKTKGLSAFKYASLAKHSFKSGPKWMRASSGLMCHLVDAILLIAQIGVCCVYLIFVVDNISSILGSYKVELPKMLIFLAIFPIALLLSYIKTLKRLSIASATANLLQVLCISIILEYLIRDLHKVDLVERDNFMPFEDVALGFGSAMFAFEGISVVLPVYTRMKQPEQMSSCAGVTNLTYTTLLLLNFAMGFFGYLKFGRNSKDSITLNLPPEPLYDAVRAMYAISVFLTYPLQFYVPNEIIWNWIRKNLLTSPTSSPSIKPSTAKSIEVVIPAGANSKVAAVSAATVIVNGGCKADDFKKIECSDIDKESNIKYQQKRQNECQIENNKKAINGGFLHHNQTSQIPTFEDDQDQQAQFVKYEYCCRTLLVIITFILAMTVPKLNLLMDLIGSISGTALSLIIPAIIHIAAFWDDTRGFKKASILLVDSTIIAVGLLAGISGSIFSMTSIIESFNE